MKKKGKKKTKKSGASQDQQRSPTRDSATTAPAISDTSGIDENNVGEDYDEKVRELVDPWRVLASENRKEGLKSLSELLRDTTSEADEKKKKRIALEKVKSMVIKLGSLISRFIAEYIFVYWHYETKEVSAKARALANTIRLECLHHGGADDHDRFTAGSAIIDSFVAAIEAVEREIKYPVHYNDRDYFFDDSADEEEDHWVWVSEIENRVLGAIFYRVLFLEIVFCFPGFYSGEDDEDGGDSGIGRVAGFIANQSCFLERLKFLRSEIDALKKDEIENKRMTFPEEIGPESDPAEDPRLKTAIGLKIKEIWNQL